MGPKSLFFLLWPLYWSLRQKLLRLGHGVRVRATHESRLAAFAATGLKGLWTSNIAALVITCTIVGAPYYGYSIMYPNTLF